MAEQQQSIGSEEGVPLLRPRDVRPNALARLLNRAAGRRGGGPSNMVRETAAVQLEERRADWGYSKPVVALDIAWNLAFTVVSIVMLSSTLGERPNTPIRVWIGGYALQCVIHVLLVSLEYRRRRRTLVVVNNTRTRTTSTLTTLEEGLRTSTSSSSSSDDDSEDDEVDGARTSFSANTGNRSSIAKRCESINTMASFFWWIVGFYWIVSGGDILLHNAPRLYWLAVVFLAFDVFFAIFCVALACMIGIALCCCLPCIIAVLYAVAGQEGATESDLSILRKYNYKVFTDGEKSTGGAGRMVPVHGELADTHVLLPEDAECCICLSSYEDAAELHALPCSHHFHSTCIVKWLKINASCPLCKYNILKGNDQI